jgi:anti-sigma factor RsiW
MTGPVHDRAQLGAFAIGALDPVEARMVHEHISGCHECQREVNELMMIRRALDQVPPEAFLDGPPENGDLLLRRTLRRLSTDAGAGAAQPPRRRMTAMVAVAAAAAGIALAGGVILGRESVNGGTALPPPTTVTATPDTSTPANAPVFEATNSQTGTSMRVAVEPKKGWVWLHTDVTGLTEGLRCEVLVVPKVGKPVLAGSWTVSADGEKNGTRLEGTADVDPKAVKAIQIVTVDGDVMVEVPVSS